MNNVESQIGLMNQSELSTMLGVDRGLITKWQKFGLPYREYGTENMYQFSIVLYWSEGHKHAKELGLNEHDPALCWLLGYAGCLEFMTPRDYQDKALERCVLTFGLSESETYFRLGILRGIGVY